MSEQREVVDPSTGREISLREAMDRDPEEFKRLREEKKARYIRIRERGMTADRLHVELPPHLHGEWVPNDKQAIYEKSLLGFKIDDTYATKRALHDQGDGRSIVGDCVYMVCDALDKEILDEIRREEFEKANGKPGVVKRQQEEKDFKAATETLGIGPVIEESSSRTARKAELEASLAQVNKPAESVVKRAAQIIR